MKIALSCNVKKKELDKPPDYFSEFDSEETILSISSVIKGLGHEVILLETTDRYGLIDFFQNNSVDIVFNIAEGSGSGLRESEVPALLDFLGVPYTGSGPFTLALALDKAMAKRIFKYEGIPTPNFQVFHSPFELLAPHLKFPLIVKPNREGSGKGISSSSVVNNSKDLSQQVNKVIDFYQQEALVEEFIDGKELTVGVLSNGKTTVMPILEIDFSGCRDSGEYFYSWKMKEFQGNKELGLIPAFYCPARLSATVAEKVKEAALRAHKALGCLDISRTDIRLDSNNIPYVLEVNPLPGIDPQESNFPMIAKTAGIDYKNLIKSILESALERYGITSYLVGRTSTMSIYN